MSPLVPPSAVRGLATEGLSAALVPAARQTHGAVLRPFEPLLRRLGSKVAADIVLLEHALAAPGGAAALDEAWAALGRLESQLGVLQGDELLRVGLDAQYRRQALEALDQDFTKPFTEAAADGLRALRSEQAAKAAAKAAGGKLTPGGVIAELDRRLARADADPVLIALWKQFRLVVPPLSPFAGKAAEVAAARAQAVWEILQTKGVVAGRSALMGHVVNVRAPLGEGFALTNAVVRADLEAELALAKAAAVKLGPGHEAVYLTQAENGLRLAGGGEGPDAVVAIVNRERGTFFTKTGVQVKIADDSEAVEQTINDILRSAGIEKRGIESPAWIEFKLTGASQPEYFALTTHPLVERRNIIINASGSRTSPADTTLLDALGFPVDEHVLPLTVGQFTHLAVAKLEAALEAAQGAGLLQKLAGAAP